MARLNRHQLVQRVDDDLVIVDESTGQEVLIERVSVGALRLSIDVLYRGETL